MARGKTKAKTLSFEARLIYGGIRFSIENATGEPFNFVVTPMAEDFANKLLASIKAKKVRVL